MGVLERCWHDCMLFTADMLTYCRIVDNALQSPGMENASNSISISSSGATMAVVQELAAKV